MRTQAYYDKINKALENRDIEVDSDGTFAILHGMTADEIGQDWDERSIPSDELSCFSVEVEDLLGALQSKHGDESYVYYVVDGFAFPELDEKSREHLVFTKQEYMRAMQDGIHAKNSVKQSKANIESNIRTTMELRMARHNAENPGAFTGFPMGMSAPFGGMMGGINRPIQEVVEFEKEAYLLGVANSDEARTGSEYEKYHKKLFRSMVVNMGFTLAKALILLYVVLLVLDKTLGIAEIDAYLRSKGILLWVYVIAGAVFGNVSRHRYHRYGKAKSWTNDPVLWAILAGVIGLLTL